MLKKILPVVIIVSVFLILAKLAVSFEQKKNNALGANLELLSDVLAIVDADYIREVKSKELIYGALEGMLSSLDSYSQFMDPDTFKELTVDTEGKFGGLGIEIASRDGLLTIITPLEGTPAWKAGIKSGDRIVRINDESARGLNLSEAMKKLRGAPGKTVGLTILREPENRLLEFKITRSIIKINDIKVAEILEDGIGYIRVLEFRETTPKDFNLALERLTQLKMRSFILDLRNNPGGLLESALKVIGKFIPRGKLMVYTQARKKNQNLKFYAQEKFPLLNLSMVVLINEGSASGSEIVAAALQDYQRAYIIGTKSFGKGLMQTIIPLADGSALRLSTSKYFTPLGKEIEGRGVIPDFVVDTPKNKENEEEEILEGAWDYKSDLQVMAAVNFLKAAQLNRIE